MSSTAVSRIDINRNDYDQAICAEIMRKTKSYDLVFCDSVTELISRDAREVVPYGALGYAYIWVLCKKALAQASAFSIRKNFFKNHITNIYL